MRKKLRLISILFIVLLTVFVLIVFNRKQNVNKIYPSVVHIECKNDRTTTIGSGIVYNSKDGLLYIVTNYHIIEGYSKINIYDEDFNKEKASLIGYDEEDDIAILTINNKLNVKKASFDLDVKIKKGDKAYILTSFKDKGTSYVVKESKVVQTNLKIDLGIKEFTTIKLEYDVENGDSGSPVLNKKGKVIGMLFLKEKDDSNYGYAIPIEDVLIKVKEIINNKSNSLNLGALMTNSTNIELLREYNIDEKSQKGVVILSIKKNYPLYNSKLDVGDLIVEFDNKQVDEVTDLEKYLKKHKKNDEVSIKYYRNERLIETKVKLTK